MAKNVMESDFRASKMGVDSHFVNKFEQNMVDAVFLLKNCSGIHNCR